MSYSVHINLIEDNGMIDYDIVAPVKADRLSHALALIEAVVINRPAGEAYDLTIVHTPERNN